MLEDKTNIKLPVDIFTTINEVLDELENIIKYMNDLKTLRLEIIENKKIIVNPKTQSNIPTLF